MSRTFKSLSIAVAASFAIVSAAASAGGGGAKGNLVAAAMSSKEHQTLVAAVKTAGLVDTLASGGPFTVFAPTDAAFGKLAEGTVDTLLQPANRDQLRAVLTYHVVPGKVTAAELAQQIQQNSGQVMLKTLQGGMLTASLSGGSVVITDATGGTATITNADLMQSNGIIHVTDAVSLPM